MKLKLSLGIFLAAIAMFGWGFVCWSFLSGPAGAIRTLSPESEEKISSALRESIPETGFYFLPAPPEDMGDEAANEALAERHQRGPIAGVMIQKEGTPPLPPTMMLKGVVHTLLTATGLALLMQLLAKRHLTTYGRRVLFAGAIGLFTAIWVDLSSFIWMYHPIEPFLFNAIYHTTGTLVGGLVLAVFVKPQTVPG